MIYNFDNLEKVFNKKTNIGYIGAIFICIFILGLIFGIQCLSWWIGMLLWNNVLCTIFTAIPTITFWQFAGIEILTSILFKSSHLNSNSKKD